MRAEVRDREQHLPRSPSTEADQPLVRYTAARHSKVDAPVTRWASPGPLVKYSAPSTHVAPTPAECGRPSGRTLGGTPRVAARELMRDRYGTPRARRLACSRRFSGGAVVGR